MSADLFDPETGEVKVDDVPEADRVAALEARCAALEAVIATVTADLQGCERDLRTSRRKAKALEDELKKQLQEAPEMVEVRTIFRYWIDKTGRDPKRTKLGDKRAKTVLARLREGHAADRLLRAVDGAVLGAAVSNQEAQRQALLRVMRLAVERADPALAEELRSSYRDAMKHVQVYDDLELICRDEVKVERFAALADRLDPPRPQLAV